jgi:hypothetical protein
VAKRCLDPSPDLTRIQKLCKRRGVMTTALPRVPLSRVPLEGLRHDSRHLPRVPDPDVHERFALMTSDGEHFLGLNASDEHIERVSGAEQAWQFHTHERAVEAAIAISRVYGEPVDVVRVV